MTSTPPPNALAATVVVLVVLGIAAWMGIVLALGLLGFHAGWGVLFCVGMAAVLLFISVRLVYLANHTYNKRK